MNKRTKALKKELNGLMRTIHKKERHFHIYPMSKKFFFHLSDASKLWFQGAGFSKLSRFCYVDEGEVVRYFRMSIQVLREIYSSGAISNSLKEKVKNCLNRINRDVVDAERQLRQEM